jgi:hypothetical protein
VAINIVLPSMTTRAKPAPIKTCSRVPSGAPTRTGTTDARDKPVRDLVTILEIGGFTRSRLLFETFVTMTGYLPRAYRSPYN